eukprot:7899-Heterococcus_DN1.PRE.1
MEADLQEYRYDPNSIDIDRISDVLRLSLPVSRVAVNKCWSCCRCCRSRSRTNAAFGRPSTQHIAVLSYNARRRCRAERAWSVRNAPLQLVAAAALLNEQRTGKR